MPTDFPRSHGSIRSDSFRRTVLMLLVAVIILGAWMAWFVSASIPRYEVSNHARLEVAQAPHPIQPRVAGRVSVTHLEMGASVSAGDILLELETDAERFRLAEEKTRLSALAPQMTALRQSIAAEEQARDEERQASKLASEVAQAQVREAEALAKLADEEARRMERLKAEGILAEAESRRGAAEAERRRAAADSLLLAASKLEPESRARSSDREARLKQLRAELERLAGAETATAAAIRRLEHDLERRLVRAPVDGHLGEVAVLRPGAFVNEGERLGVILPAGRLRLVAEFAPPAALGRIRPGQPAKLRLHGFPWAQYGSIPARVEAVAGEIRENRVRVELRVEASSLRDMPLQHGMPGAVEVEVERATPAALVLRAAGRLLTSPRSWLEDSADPQT